MSDVIHQDNNSPEPSEPVNPDLEETKKRAALEILATMNEYRIQPESLKMSDKPPLAKGGQGTVVLATIKKAKTLKIDELSEGQEDQEVAVKKLDLKPGEGRKSLNAFVNELTIATDLLHPNVAEFIGFVEDFENGVAWMVLPLATHGNAREFLASGTYDIPERMYLIMGTLRGIRYLHEQDPPICHGDLKS
ncbi:hypothetical protein FRB90_008900, partial [Tulasnella sp. 427]